jgi:hypothetical protein
MKDEHTLRQLLISALALFNCFLVALIVIITPTRIAQTFYDLGQGIREHPLGWLLLAVLIRLFTPCTHIQYVPLTRIQQK